MLGRSWLLWTPRVLAVAVCLFLSLFALDEFAAGRPFAAAFPAFLVHLVPVAILGVVVAFAWRRPTVGAAVFLTLGALYAWMVWGRPSWILTISGPLWLVGFLFVLSARGGRGKLAALIIAAVAVGSTVAVAQERAATTAVAVQQFQKGIDRYLALRWKAIRELPPLPAGGELRELIPVLEAQIRMVRRAHEDAKTGEIFTPQVAALFRVMLQESIEEAGHTVAGLLAEMDFDVPSFLLPLRVNDRAPWVRAVPAPDCVLMALPGLPYELQYRLVRRDLVLFDVDLGLVVDVLPDALIDDAKR